MASCFRSYLIATWRALLAFWVMLGIVNLVLLLSAPLRTVWVEVGYLNLLLVAVGAAFYAYGFLSYRSKRRRIVRALTGGQTLMTALDGPQDEHTRLLARCVRHESARAEARCARLEAELQEQRDVLACWAHEVKTPLAVIELILSREEADPVRKPMKQQLARIQAQLKSVLHLERLRHLDQSVEMRALSVPRLLKSAVARNAALLQGRGLSMSVDSPEMDAMGDEPCALYILDQLLLNAAKHAPEGSEVRISAAFSGRRALIMISNDGEIDGKLIGRVFDKGFSGERGQTASGMGLFYARQTAHALGGRLHVDSAGGQITFTLELPSFAEYLQPGKREA